MPFSRGDFYFYRAARDRKVMLLITLREALSKDEGVFIGPLLQCRAFAKTLSANLLHSPCFKGCSQMGSRK